VIEVVVFVCNFDQLAPGAICFIHGKQTSSLEPLCLLNKQVVIVINHLTEGLACIYILLQTHVRDSNTEIGFNFCRILFEYLTEPENCRFKIALHISYLSIVHKCLDNITFHGTIGKYQLIRFHVLHE